MDTHLEYLFSFLEDEFKDYPNVRIRLTPVTGTRKSPDLEQDYDPDESDLHRMRGVIVRTAQREYYFPAEWVSSRQYSEVQKLARQIKDTL